MATTPDLSIYLVTDPELGGGPEKVADIVDAAVAGGVTVVQLRDKDASDEQVAERARELIERVGDVPLFIDDRLDVAQELGIHLHIGQTDVPYVEARRALPEHLMIGLSAASREQVDAVVAQCREAELPLPDLIGIGPVYTTTTKKNAPEACGVEHLDDVAAYARTQGIASVAIGGINAQRVAEVAKTSVDGLCVVSDIMTAEDPRAAAEALVREWKAVRG